MTNFNNFNAISVCSLSLRRGIMNLRKSRFSSRQKRNSSYKDIKSSVKKGTRNVNSTRCSQKSSPETPLKSQKSVLNNVFKVRYSSRLSSNLNLLTSTPIPKEAKKRTRSSGRCDLEETVKLKSFNRLSSPITSSPIQKTLIQTKPCEVRLIALTKSSRQRYSDEGKSDRSLRSNKKSSYSSLNTPVKILKETRSRSTRSSMTLRPQSVSEKTPNGIKMPLSRKSNSTKKISITEKHLINSRKSAENDIVLQKESKNKKRVKKTSVCAEKLPMPSTSKDASTASGKSEGISIAKTISDEISWTSRDSLVQSYCETDNSKSSRYSLRNSIVPQKKSSCKKKIKDKKSLSESQQETETSKSSGCSLQLQNQHLSKRVSGNRLSSDSLILRDITETPKSLLEPSSDGEKRSSRHSLRLKEIQLSKKTTVNESSPEHSSKKTSTKKLNVKKVQQSKTSKSCKKSSSSSKKQQSTKKSVERNFLSLEDIPIDDLVLKSPEKRKVKSDGFKVPSKNTLKRKRSAIEAIIKADEDYEDDLYESKKFDQFKELLMDTSDSERSFAVSTPKFPCTPLIRHKTPKFKDCFSPGEYQISRKAAMEYIYKKKKSKSGHKPPVPVKNKLVKTKDYKILPEWFTRKDNLGHRISSWCKKLNEEEVLCIICNKNIFCTKKGFSALTQHFSRSVHQTNANLKLGGQQLFLTPPSVENVKSTQDLKNAPCTEIKLYNSKEASTKAELIWTLKSVACNMASSVGDDLEEVFNAMFPGALPDNFHLGRTKLTYYITEALGPYFRDELLSDLKKSPYSLLYDETTNNANKKELQLTVRYWSEEERQVVCKYLKTIFLGHATAKVVTKEIKNVLNSLCLKKQNILMFGSDGPNVNKKIWHIFNDELIEERGHCLLDIGTCNLHTVHNAFLRGIEEFGETGSDLIVDIYNFFKKYPSRWEDFENVQNKVGTPKHRFLKHVSSRWLTIGSSSQRLLEQWAALEEYFFIFIPANEKKMMQTEKYKHITKYMKYIDIKVELCFIKESSELFTQFVEFFQRSEPLIHLLYSQLNDLLFKISGRICKEKSNALSSVPKAIEIEDLRRAGDIDCGEVTSKLLKKLSEKDKLNTLFKIQRHYMAAYNYLVKKCLLNNVIHFKCFQINEINKASSVMHVSDLAKKLSFLDINDLNIKDEWRLLQSQFIEPTEPLSRIDHFWRDIIYEKTSLGSLKYPSIAKLVKASLSLSHGNSDVERGFSISRRVLPEEKASMSERCLDARLMIKDGLKKYDTVAQVPITKKLLNLAYSARKSYEIYLEEQAKLKEAQVRKEKEEEEKLKQEMLKTEKFSQQKEKIEQLESKAKIVTQEKKVAQKSSDGLFKEAHERLKTAIQKNDLVQIKIAQGMLEGVEKLRQKEREQDEKEEKLIKIVNKRKSSIIDSFVKKDPKKKKL